jgi:hypothetical protein
VAKVARRSTAAVAAYDGGLTRRIQKLLGQRAARYTESEILAGSCILRLAGFDSLFDELHLPSAVHLHAVHRMWDSE